MMEHRLKRSAAYLNLALALALGHAAGVQAQTAGSLVGQEQAIARLGASTGGAAEVTLHEATGAARFVRLAPGRVPGLVSSTSKASASRSLRSDSDDLKQRDAVQFLGSYGDLFGIRNTATELSTAAPFKDTHGGTHFSHKQVYKGVPVFGAELKSHFDAAGQLTVVNGTFVPAIDLDPVPTHSAAEAAARARRMVGAELGKAIADRLRAGHPRLLVYREGLAKGVAGVNHLAWEVEVGNGVDVREFVFIDAHTGKFVDRITGIHDGMNRRAFDAANATQPGPNYPAKPYWTEGSPFPTGTVEADNMIAASSDIYNLFKNAFGRDSFDAKGATMDSIFNRGDGCPNASWNGTYISFCPGTTTDDVTAHEWAHAYTQYTHGLIYQWQPGALNEAYSDIWGETVDRINGRGTDTPDTARSPGVCAVDTIANGVTISGPATFSPLGLQTTGKAAFGPQTFSIGVTPVAGVGVSTTTAACSALPAGSLAGKIAYIDRGSCNFAVQAKNAENAGATAVIIGNNTGGTTVQAMGATAGVTNGIPALMVSQNTGTAIKGKLSAGVTASMLRTALPSYNTVRWLLGEDATAFGGAIRDMYNPTCYGNPGKVSDTAYSCTASDSGGVHNNSGVVNHGYALLVDGGTYNGLSITGIGLTKAAHIYYRAQSVYQVPSSGFPEHADAITQSCTDLTGTNLPSLTTGLPSGATITAFDCQQVAQMAAAVELRKPTCVNAPLLAQSPPALCPAATPYVHNIAFDGFDGGRVAGLKWLLGNNIPKTSAFTPRSFGVVSKLPSFRAGYGIYAADITGPATSCNTTSEAGTQRLDSPDITIPAGATTLRLSFSHMFGTERGFDGGNVKISVNGGVTWQVVSAANFIYNPYNTTLYSAIQTSDNPMAGEEAFSDSETGKIGTWGTSIINLAPYAAPGATVRIRFELGNDCGGGGLGWYLDSISLDSCSSVP